MHSLHSCSFQILSFLIFAVIFWLQCRYITCLTEIHICSVFWHYNTVFQTWTSSICCISNFDTSFICLASYISFVGISSWIQSEMSTQAPPTMADFLHTFIDSFQGCYKDGTEPGTRDCRWFSAMPFILRFLIFTCYMSSSAVTYPFASIILTFTTLSVIVVNPYKKRFEWHSTQLRIFILFLSCVSVCVIGIDYPISNANLMNFFIALMCTFGFLQMIYVFVFILHWIIIQRNFRMKIIKLGKPGVSVESQDLI